MNNIYVYFIAMISILQIYGQSLVSQKIDFTINSINQEVIESCVSESSKFLAYEYNDLSLLELDHLKLKTVVDDILKSNLSFAETSSKYYFYDSITLVNCPIGTYYCNSVQMQILIKYNKKTYERILRYEPKKI